MKVETVNKEKFTPIEIKLTIESEEELCNLWHRLNGVSSSSEHKECIEAYKECFETFIPNDKWDEATLFLSTYGSGLAKDLARREL